MIERTEMNDFRTTDYVAAGTASQNNEPVESRDGAQMVRESQPQALLNEQESDSLRRQWNDVQASFVDEPQSAVKQADELVASTVKRLADSFAAERDKLEKQWDSGGDVSTEELRQVLQRYRAFFNRLLSI